MPVDKREEKSTLTILRGGLTMHVLQGLLNDSNIHQASISPLSYSPSRIMLIIENIILITKKFSTYGLSLILPYFGFQNTHNNNLINSNKVL